MSDITTKIRMKIGQLELDYEGRESFLINDLSNLLDKIADLSKKHTATQLIDTSSESESVLVSTNGTKKIELSTATIASRMDAKSGPELAIAACAHLTFAKSKGTFSLAEIRTEMKNASSYYKASMASNLSKALKNLVKKQRLNETASDSYALTAAEKDAMEKLLA